ncbi:MAG: DNA repair protein RecN [Clostridia bacterium]|nr:DNA repair protein RecN [Clostridia bacterium]
MLKTLQIQNIALIDTLSVTFSPGMNCLTGETGAGKSIMIDAISALMGSRTSKELIRSGTEMGRVLGEFTAVSAYTTDTLLQLGIPVNGDHVVTLDREIALNGRNVCRINGKTVSSSVLRQVGESMIDIHGQHDNQSLTKPESHGRLLDAFAGAEIDDLLQEYNDTLKRFRERQKALEALSGDPVSRARAADLLLYQIREIEGAQLTVEEEETLLQRRNILDHGEKIARTLQIAAGMLTSDRDTDTTVLTMLGDLKHELSGITALSSEFESISGDVESLLYEAEALSDKVRKAAEKNCFDPEEAEWVRKRYDYIQTLKGKYGDSVEAVLRFLEDAQAQYDFLTGSEEQAAQILQEMQALSAELYGLCEEISFTRKKYGDLLEQRIQEELEDLEMPGTRFAVRLDFAYETDEQGFPQFGKYGLDDIEFLISANPGEPLLPLARIASGGELSRIMLAVKRILNESDRVSTMIFDEIDTGISGVAARKIAEKMRAIATGHQVICVTHHAQIAAAADHNLYVSKESSGERTVTRVDILDDFTKIQEVSRLLDGDKENAITNDHARTLIERYHA